MSAPAPRRVPALHRVLAAAALLGGLHAAPAIAANWTMVIPACTPDSKQTVEWEFTSRSGGYARAGRNPPLAYFCPVGTPDDFAAKPPTRLQLQYLDPNSAGGAVKARLYQKHRVTGATKLLSVASSVPSPSIAVVQSTLRGTIDIATYTYYITVEMNTTSLPVEGHMVMLVD